MKFLRLLLIIGLLVTASFFNASSAEAHAGGKMQVSSEDAGAFKLTVWTSPDPAVTGEIHVATSVASAETALPILDAEVFVEMIPQNGGGETIEAQARTDNSANQFLYEAIMEVPDEGLYEVSITVIGAGTDWGNVAFDLEVGEPTPFGLGLIALVGLAVITGIAVWFYLRSSNLEPVLEEADEFDAAAG